MSEEDIKEAVKLFDREDLLSDYGIQDTDTNIEVFMSVKDMIKYYKQGKEIEKLNNIINELEEYLIEQVEKSYSNDYDNVLDKLDELKGSDKE